MDSTEYARLLKGLLPEGPAWPHETDENSSFDGLLRALAIEPSRLEADALLLLDNLIPDNTNTNLTAWERLVGAPETSMTDAERLARIRGLLRGNVAISRADLEAAFQSMAGDANVKLFDRELPSFGAGYSGAGSPVGLANYTWVCELMPNILDALPDDFNGWGTFSSATNNDAQSPVTYDQTAATVQFPGGGASVDLLNTANGDAVYVSLWVKPLTDGLFAITISGRDGISPSGDTYDLPVGVWHKITYEQSVGTGGSTPSVIIDGAAANDYVLSWAVAGVRDVELEARCKALTHIHTRGIFGVQGEWETLLANYS